MLPCSRTRTLNLFADDLPRKNRSYEKGEKIPNTEGTDGIGKYFLKEG